MHFDTPKIEDFYCYMHRFAVYKVIGHPLFGKLF
jgi:hypothetical protein